MARELPRSAPARRRCATGSCAQRWFGSKASEVAHLNILEAFTLREERRSSCWRWSRRASRRGRTRSTRCRSASGPASEGWERPRDRRGGRQHLLRRARRPRARARAAAPDARAAPTCRPATGRSRSAGPAAPARAGRSSVRPVGVEQSNSSIVFGETLILKAFRRVEPGVNPELELLRFLSERDFPHIAPIAGWFQYDGRLMDATLGVLQEYLAGATDGWDLALDALGQRPRGVPRRGARARRGHRRDAQRARLGGDRPRVRARGAERARRSRSSPRRSTRRSSGSSSSCPRTRRSTRSAAAGRTCRSGCRCSPRSARAGA